MGRKIEDDYFDRQAVDKVEETYKDGHEYEKVDNTYFVFVDVLGFKKTIDEHRDVVYREGKYEGEEEFEEKYKDIFCEYFDFVDELGKDIDNEEFYTGQISDSLFFYTSKIAVLSQYIDILLKFLLFAMREKVFVRGGIAKGTLYIDKKRRNQYYGDCVAYAYLLESSVAKYPRIMVDTSTYNDLCDAYKNVSEEELKRRKSIFVRESEQGSGRQWLNNFYCFENETIFQRDMQGGKKIENLRLTIERNIDLNIKREEFDNSTYEKYVTLKKEFERICKKMSGGKHE